MKFQKFNISVLCLVLLSFTFSSASAASIEKSKCQKLGSTTSQNGIVYLCSKSSRGPIWTVKKVVSKPTSSTSNIQLEEFATSMGKLMKSAAASSDISIHTDPKLADSNWNRDIQSGIQSAQKLMAVFGVDYKNHGDLYVSWGTDFLSKDLPAWCIGKSLGGSCGNGKIFADLKFAVSNWGYGDAEQPYKSEMDKFIINANIPHEMGHLSQEQAAQSSGNPETYHFMPSWLREGGAEYFKFLTYSYDQKVTYSHLHDLYLNSGAQYCLKSKILQSTSPDGLGDSCEYTKGLFAVEYLTLKTGKPDAFLQFVKTSGTNAEDTFLKAYGMKFTDFAKGADDYFASLFPKTN